MKKEEGIMKGFSFKDENGKIYYGWWIVLTAAVVTGFVYSGIVSATGAFMLPVTQDLGLSVAAYSLYLTIMSLTSILTLVIVSKHMDRKNIKKLMITAGVIGIISFAGFAIAQDLWMFYIFAVPQGFCFAAMTMTPCQLLVSNWFGEKAKGRAMSIFLAGMQLIFILELNVLTAVIGRFSWRAGYIMVAVFIVISLLFVMKFVKWSPEDRGIKRIGDPDPEETATVLPAVEQGVEFGVAIRKPVTWLVLASCCLAVVASSSILQHGIPTMVVAGFTPAQATAVTSALSLVAVLIGPFIGWVCDRKLSVGAICSALCFALSTVGLSMLSVSKSAVAVYGVFWILGVATVNIVSPLLMSYMYGEKAMPRLLGYVNIFIGIGGAFGAAGLGALYEKFGSYQMPWLIATAALLIVTVIRAYSTAPKRKYDPEKN